MSKIIDYIPISVLIVIALNQIAFLQPFQNYSKWKGGGFGVYCKPYEYFLLTYIQVDDNRYLLLPKKGTPLKYWANEDYLTDYGRKYLNKSYVIEKKISNNKIVGCARPNSWMENYSLIKAGSQSDVDNIIHCGAVEKVTVQLWEVKLISHNSYSTRLIKISENAK